MNANQVYTVYKVVKAASTVSYAVGYRIGRLTRSVTHRNR